jgi:hypothetical protein
VFNIYCHRNEADEEENIRTAKLYQSFTLSEVTHFSICIEKRKANWVGHMLHRNCVLKHLVVGKTEGRIEVTERRGIRSKQLVGDRNETRGYWRLKEEALDQLCGEFTFEEAMDLS